MRVTELECISSLLLSVSRIHSLSLSQTFPFSSTLPQHTHSLPMQHAFPQDPIALAATASKVSSVWNSSLLSFSSCKYYFNVSQQNVLAKCALILFPFRGSSHKWQRSFNTLEGNWKSPREDANAPDLYIPLMGMLTFVLLVGLSSALASPSNALSPELLYKTISTALVFSAIEVGLVKCGAFFVLTAGDSAISVVDLLAVSGYKFVPIVLCQAVGMVFGRMAMWICFAYACCLALWLFEVRSLRGLFLAATSTEASVRQKRIYFLFAVAVLQVASGFVLLRWAC